jgi:flagellin
MALVVNTNLAAMNAANNTARAESGLRTAMERLSSGQRINSAADDAAGLAISERMQTQIRGFNQAIRNVNDGVSMVQSVDGALGEITDALQRMRELAVQAVNGSNTAMDRIALQNELSSLTEQINLTAGSTRFNGMSLLNGNFTGREIQAGASVGETIGVAFDSARADDLGMYFVETSLTAAVTSASGLDDLFFDNGSVQFAEFGPPNGATADNSMEEAHLSIAVRGGRQSDLSDASFESAALVYIDQYDEASDIVAKVNASGAGVKAYAETEVQVALANVETTNIVDSTDPTATVAQVTITLGSGQRAGAYTSFTIGSGALEDKATFASAMAAEVNASTGIHGITATVDPESGESLSLFQAEGRDIKMFADFTDNSQAGLVIHEKEIDGNTDALDADEIIDSTADFGLVQAGQVTFYSGSEFQLQDTDDTDNFDSENTRIENLGGVDLTRTSTARRALAIIDAAIEAIGAQRATAGALQNRFELSIQGLTVASENQSAAYSRIVDADYAAESSALAKNQILQQVSTAMLAQANAMPQVALSLIQ